MLTDTHAHLEAFETHDELPAVLHRAWAAGVGRILAVGGTPEGNRAATVLAAQDPARFAAAVGFDRALAGQVPDRAELETLAAAPGVRAIGEIGLDYHYQPQQAAEQKALLEEMLELARRLCRPVILHCREAEADLLALLREHLRTWPGPADRPGVLHCFTGDFIFARQLLDEGWMIGCSGIVTFANATRLRNVVAQLPLDRLLLETDCPYLAPVPHRGQRNEPAFLPAVAAQVASLHGVAVETLAEVTSGNAAQLFEFETNKG